MQLSLQNFQQIVSNSAAAVQGAAKQLLDLTVGSVLRAILEANASIALWLQWLLVEVLSVTRLATSVGGDVDTFVNDFSLTRLPAVAATGAVTFSRITTGVTTLIPVGAQAKTADGTQTFQVTADATNAAWDAVQNGYDVGASASGVTVPVQAAVAGSAGNAQANTITLMASAIAGIDSVTNALAFFNGFDAESDTALKARFVLYIAGLSKATKAAVESAVANVQQGLNYGVVENSPTSGNFVVVVDDGTGNPPTTLLNAVFAAVDLVRPVGTAFTAIGPVVTNVAITFTITVAAGVNKTNLIGPVDTAVIGYVNGLGIGQTLPVTKITQIVYDLFPGQITNITLPFINGRVQDIVIGATGVIKCTSCVAS